MSRTSRLQERAFQASRALLHLGPAAQTDRHRDPSQREGKGDLFVRRDQGACAAPPTSGPLLGAYQQSGESTLEVNAELVRRGVQLAAFFRPSDIARAAVNAFDPNGRWLPSSVLASNTALVRLEPKSGLLLYEHCLRRLETDVSEGDSPPVIYPTREQVVDYLAALQHAERIFRAEPAHFLSTTADILSGHAAHALASGRPLVGIPPSFVGVAGAIDGQVVLEIDTGPLGQKQTLSHRTPPDGLCCIVQPGCSGLQHLVAMNATGRNFVLQEEAPFNAQVLERTIRLLEISDTIQLRTEAPERIDLPNNSVDLLVVTLERKNGPGVLEGLLDRAAEAMAKDGTALCLWVSELANLTQLRPEDVSNALIRSGFAVKHRLTLQHLRPLELPAESPNHGIAFGARRRSDNRLPS